MNLTTDQIAFLTKVAAGKSVDGNSARGVRMVHSLTEYLSWDKPCYITHYRLTQMGRDVLAAIAA